MLWHKAIASFWLIWIVLLVSFPSLFIASQNHHGSFLSQEIALDLLNTGLTTIKDKPLYALDFLLHSYNHYPSLSALELAVSVLDNSGYPPEIGRWVFEASSLNKEYKAYFTDLTNAIHSYRDGRLAESMAALVYIQSMFVCSSEAFFHLGLVNQALGRVDEAIMYYHKAIQCNPIHTKTIVNMASLYQKSGQLRAAIDMYCDGIATLTVYRHVVPGYVFLSSNEIFMRSNLAMAFFADSRSSEALRECQDLLDLLHTSRNMSLEQDSSRSTAEVDVAIVNVQGSLSMIARSILLWKDLESRLHLMLQETLSRKRMNIPTIHDVNQLQGPYLPFDSLLDDVSLPDRLELAEFASRVYTSSTAQAEPTLSITEDDLVDGSLTIGMYSCDFNDHPTAHMTIGLFLHLLEQRKHSQQQTSQPSWYNRIRLIVYNYGQTDDSSDFRRFFISFADKFVDTQSWSHAQVVQEMHDVDQLDVLLEMQVHTRGHRLGVTAQLSGKVPHLVNYLVYPGTAGATFLDHLVCDQVVVPVEHIRHYSEKVLYLPHTYQLSYYNRDVMALEEAQVLSVEELYLLQRKLRKEHNLPMDDDAIILANFNKIDKLDPRTFLVWMNIMRRLPKAYLWLLAPPGNRNLSTANSTGDISSPSQYDLMLQHLTAYAAYFGVNLRDRILIAERTTKAKHIARHAAADLFLDSFQYGAHSTATDCLRGGLPVLTLAGDSFPNRVATSLYHAMDSDNSIGDTSDVFSSKSMYTDLLVTHSLRDFEDHAVRLCQPHNRPLLQRLTLQLHKAIALQAGIFDSDEHSKRLFVALSALKESRRAGERLRKQKEFFAASPSNQAINTHHFNLIIVPRFGNASTV